jgi:uncharacterized protein (DUF58 family)
MRIHRREYLIAGAVFLSIGLFGIFTDRWESLFVFFILGAAFLGTALTRKTPNPSGRRPR